MNARGFTLAGLVIGVAIGGIVLLGMAAAVSMTFKAQKNLDHKTISANYVDELARIVAGTGSCARALGTATAATSLTATPTEITVMGMQAGSFIAQNIEIEELRIRENTAIPAVTGPGGTGFQRRAAILSVKLRNALEPTMPYRAREIPFRVVTNPGGQIVSCSTENSEVQVCERIGGTWDPLAAEGQKWRPKGFCLYGGSFSAAPQGGYANPVTGAYSCNPGFTQQQSGSIANTVAQSKENFVTSYYPVYTCMRCETDIPPQNVAINTSTADFTDAVNDALAAGNTQDGFLFNAFNFFNGFF